MKRIRNRLLSKEVSRKYEFRDYFIEISDQVRIKAIKQHKTKKRAGKIRILFYILICAFVMGFSIKMLKHTQYKWSLYSFRKLFI
jgi:hypothetical protein